MQSLKGHISLRSLVVGCVLCLACASSAFANHKTGDFALPELVVAGDFNQDGSLDLAVNVAGFDNVAIFDGDGQAGFTLRHHVETDTLPKGLAAGDVNGDRHLDLVSINEWGYTIRINLGDGLGGFIGAGELNGDGEPIRIALGDVNNDKNLDLIANGPAEGVMVIHLGDGRGGFSNSPLELADLDNDFTFAVGDVNKDGKLDLVVVTFNAAGGTAVVFLGDGRGGFDIVDQVAVNKDAASTLLGDLNNDGNIDIIIGGAGPDNEDGLFLSSYLGDGTGHFTTGQVNALGGGTLEGGMALADFNEDGNLDVAFPITFPIDEEHSKTVLMFLGDGAGGFTEGQPVKVGTGPHTATAADFNGDGHLDLAITNRFDATLSILLGDGSGTLTTHATLPVAVLPAP